MAEKTNISVIKTLTYEIIERITRFVIHLEEIEKQFYIDDSNAKDKLEFIASYKESLFKILEISILGYKEINTSKDTDKIKTHLELLKDSLKSINKLHTERLSILPRPIEPVELSRFKRVIYKQIVLMNIKPEYEPIPDISISINEQIGEEIDRDPLIKNKDEINKLIDSYNGTNTKKIDKIKDLIRNQTHITIPRIDSSNIYRWPSLIHEMSHSIMSVVEFEEDRIDKDFLKFVNSDSFIIEYFKPQSFRDGFSPDAETLRSWLNECWCDLFACILIGPSLYFSQYLAFLNEPENKNDRHPPAAFRLYLIESILMSRFPKELYKNLENYISPCEELILSFQDVNTLIFKKESELGRVNQFFKAYFKYHFFKVGDGISIHGNTSLNAKIEGIVKQYVSIQPDVIAHLAERLNIGLPIPSIKTKNTGGDYEEIPTYIQEIFLASWFSRIDVLQKDIFDAIDGFKTSGDIYEFYLKSIKGPIKRHDQAVLKSIQVSEWFDFFNKEKPRPEKIDLYKNKEKIDEGQFSGTLVDKEIKYLILSDELKIIPIMDITLQTGTTSIDIRLGTSFELFSPDEYGLIDFTDTQNTSKVTNFSKRVNLDFIEGITITPGQFILGHSMEYIKLPDYICGNLEGRSSFARLGIEIHMTAGFIDPGFEGVLTFEIFNAGSTTVKLYPGMRIGQMRFEKNNRPEKTYSERHKVKYKGLLEHNVSKQSSDIEVELLKNAGNRKK